jgi:hypothetical protein
MPDSLQHRPALGAASQAILQVHAQILARKMTSASTSSWAYAWRSFCPSSVYTSHASPPNSFYSQPSSTPVTNQSHDNTFVTPMFIT